ncbi:MAG: glycosyl transferase [Bacteroidales bacterium]|nr:glycosyl transferase [Bacteroidales bacterium]MCM1147039.1 glycosyl transferase [Bacteroidales bacterium]MCM1205828.1 glycosyl transferase [Bacillota bacterium]MCM1509929.1 glycosyl transferase [Clostridium sp.]
MIPKIIHYCWFGRNPLPEEAKKCIASWRKYLPDYEIKEWNEDNFDVNIIPYTAEAYAMKKYAFVSDYARFWILYKYGGLYFDTDVEVIRPLDDIVARGNFMGYETDPVKKLAGSINPGLGMGMASGNKLIEKMLAGYENRHFVYEQVMKNQITVVHIATQVLTESGLRSIQGMQEVDGVWVYPSEYFCPIKVTTGRMHITENTRTIHHYAGTWAEASFSVKQLLRRCLPESWLIVLSNIKRRVKKN